MTERLQKILSARGVASRRAVEAMIEQGRVQVNGHPAVLGMSVGPKDEILPKLLGTASAVEACNMFCKGEKKDV